MKEKSIHYEVFVESAYGSDVIEFDDLKEAKKCAEGWAVELIVKGKLAPHESVVVLKVEKTICHEIRGIDNETKR